MRRTQCTSSSSPDPHRLVYTHLSKPILLIAIFNFFLFQIPSISPFCLKLESWLKLHGIKYQVFMSPLTPGHPCPCLWSDQGLQQEACCSAALRPGCCSGLCRLHCSEIIPGETIHALCSAPGADFSRLEDYLCK